MMRIEMWIHRILRLPFGIGLLAVLAGCGATSSMPIRSSFIEFTPEQKAEIDVESGRPYRIQTEDVLQVTVSDQRELREEGALVLPDGAISLVGTGTLKVAGLTLGEADSLITFAYSRNVKEPDVSVVVRETKGTRVYVLGEVRLPGMQTIPGGGVGIVGAVTLAGGFTVDAAPEGTVLVRVTGSGYLVQEVDLSKDSFMHSPELAMVSLQPLDIVYVPRSRIGDFGYFSKTVLAGLVSLTRMAVDIKYLSTGGYRGF